MQHNKITVSIRQVNNNKIYDAEIYLIGFNKLDKLTIRAFDIKDKKFKLFLVEKIDEDSLTLGDKFIILRSGYKPYSDKHFKKIIKQI